MPGRSTDGRSPIPMSILEANGKLRMNGRRLEHGAHECFLTSRALEDGFKRRRLPSPNSYVKLGRFMSAVSVLREAAGQLDDAAHLAGYSTVSALQRAVKTSLELDLRLLKTYVGFEWAAYRMDLAGTRRDH